MICPKAKALKQSRGAIAWTFYGNEGFWHVIRSEDPNPRAPVLAGTIMEPILSHPAGVKSLPLLLPLRGSDECQVVFAAARALFHPAGSLNMLIVAPCH
jgi:hypothetical protein